MRMGVVQNGGQDDDKHDPVEEVDQDKGKDEPKEEWPLSRPAAVEGEVAITAYNVIGYSL